MSNKLLLLSELYRASIELMTATADHTLTWWNTGTVTYFLLRHILRVAGITKAAKCQPQVTPPYHPHDITAKPWTTGARKVYHTYMHGDTHRWDCGTFTAPRCPIKMLRGRRGGGGNCDCCSATERTASTSESKLAMKVVSWRPVSYYELFKESVQHQGLIFFLLFFFYFCQLFLVGCTNTWLGLHTQTTLFKHQNTRLNPGKHKSCGLRYMHADCHYFFKWALSVFKGETFWWTFFF